MYDKTLGYHLYPTWYPLPIEGMILEIMPQIIKYAELNENRISIRLSKFPFIPWISQSDCINL
jgi:hypothetical protein